MTLKRNRRRKMARRRGYNSPKSKRQGEERGQDRRTKRAKRRQR